MKWSFIFQCLLLGAVYLKVVVMFKRLMLCAVVVGLTGCGKVPMFVDMGNDVTLRGSASGVVGGNISFKASDYADKMECSGSFPLRGMTASGTIHCTNGLNGKFKASGSGATWRGEGEFDNGQPFRIFVNYLSDPDKR